MSIFGTRKRRLGALVAAAVFVAISGGVAFAYWTGTGTGVGTATTGTSSSFTVTSTAPVGAALVPGGGSQTVTFTVLNSAAVSQTLSAVAVTVANANGSTWVATAGCSVADYAVGAPVFVAGAIAAGADVVGTVTITMNNLSTNQDACQGVTAPLYFAAS
jgi:hypothetical protein